MTPMPEIQLTPEQDQRTREAFARRRFDPEEAGRDIAGPEMPPEVQVAIAEAKLRDRATPEQQSLETLAEQREQNERASAEFAFLDPADYVDQEHTSVGRVLTPQQFLEKLQYGCALSCWFSLGSRAMIAKELDPRDVALAYKKIGANPENLHDGKRWIDAIAEIRQEESQRQTLHGNFEIFQLQVSRSPGSEPERVCWLPGCHLREYAIVKFDAHGVPEWYIPGWRDALIALVRGRFTSEHDLDRVFGEAMGPRSRRYKMIMKGLREQPEHMVEQAAPVEIGGETSVERLTGIACAECQRKGGLHWPTCSEYEAWINAPVAV